MDQNNSIRKRKHSDFIIFHMGIMALCMFFIVSYGVKANDGPKRNTPVVGMEAGYYRIQGGEVIEFIEYNGFYRLFKNKLYDMGDTVGEEAKDRFDELNSFVKELKLPDGIYRISNEKIKDYQKDVNSTYEHKERIIFPYQY